MVRDPDEARRLAEEEIRKILFAPPDTEWRVHHQSLPGVRFTLDSTFELGAIDRAFRGTLRRSGIDTARGVDRRTRVWAAGDFLRSDNHPRNPKAPATRTLEHREHGGIYIDLADRTYLHFSPRQLPAAKFLQAAETVQLEWSLVVGKEVAMLAARGAIALDLEIAVGEGAPASVVRGALAACLPGLAALADIGLPLAELEKLGMPRAIEVWQVDRTGKRAGRLAAHRLTDIEVGPIPPDTFAIPEGFRDLRQRGEREQKWHPIHRGKYSPVRPRKTTPGHPAQPAGRMFAMAAAPAMMQFTPVGGFPAPRAPTAEPGLQSCLPSTFKTSCAYQI